jgi:hypothetical protein
LAWLLTLVAMTVAFPFAGARGGFFHSGAALQPVWWTLAPVGLDRVIAWGSRKRGWNVTQAGTVVRSALVAMAALLTAVIIYGRVMGGGGGPVWSHENIAYSDINTFLIKKGMQTQAVVMVANPPGFYLASGNPAIAIPDGDENTLLVVARRYQAEYVVLEEGSTPGGLLPVYLHPAEQAGLLYLGDVDGAQIFGIQP